MLREGSMRVPQLFFVQGFVRAFLFKDLGSAIC